MSTRAAFMVPKNPRGRRSVTDLQLCKSSQIKMQSLYDNSETGWFKFNNFLELLKTLQNINKTMSICHSPTNLYKQSCDHTAQILQREAHRNKLHIVTLRHLLSGVFLEMTQPQPVKKRPKKKRRANEQGRSFTKSANIPEWQKSPCITLQTKHFLNIAAQSMQANTWPQGSNLASAVLPHKRHFTSVSLLTADDDLAWAESVSSREGGVASSGFLADALMVNRSMNWVKKEQPSFTTTPLIAPQSSKRHKGLFFSQTRENGR